MGFIYESRCFSCAYKPLRPAIQVLFATRFLAQAADSHVLLHLNAAILQ